MAESLRFTDEILTQVIYGMENQKKRFLLNPSTGEVLPETDADQGVPLPPWGPSDGFQLMERFAAGRPDPTIRSQLNDALDAGSGVFRRFKDVLAEYQGQERLWRSFKRAEMRKTAIAWFSRWNDALSLETLGDEPENLDDLPLTDFVLRPADEDDQGILVAMDHQAIRDGWEGWSEEDALDQDRRERQDRSWDLRNDLLWVAEDAGGECAGFVWLAFDDTAKRRARFLRVYVHTGYRGLGLGERLVQSAMDQAKVLGAESFSVLSGPGGRRLEAFLERVGFSREATLWRLKEGR